MLPLLELLSTGCVRSTVFVNSGIPDNAFYGKGIRQYSLVNAELWVMLLELGSR